MFGYKSVCRNIDEHQYIEERISFFDFSNFFTPDRRKSPYLFYIWYNHCKIQRGYYNKKRVAYNMKILANNIMLLRQKYGLSKAETANILKISVSSLTKIEKGIIPPRLKVDILFYIRDHFGIPIKEIFLPQDTEE